MNRVIVLILFLSTAISVADIHAQDSFQKSRKSFVNTRFSGKSTMYKNACKKLSRNQTNNKKFPLTSLLRRSSGRRKAEQP
jgi:hypothetical protein